MLLGWFALTSSGVSNSVVIFTCFFFFFLKLQKLRRERKESYFSTPHALGFQHGAPLGPEALGGARPLALGPFRLTWKKRVLEQVEILVWVPTVEDCCLCSDFRVGVRRTLSVKMQDSGLTQDPYQGQALSFYLCQRQTNLITARESKMNSLPEFKSSSELLHSIDETRFCHFNSIPF